MNENTTWWAQTLITLGGPWSPTIYGLQHAHARNEAHAVELIAQASGAPSEPAPAVLPQIERDARARGESDAAITEALTAAIKQALEADPKGLVIVRIETDFAKVSGLESAMGHGPAPDRRAA